MQGLSLSPSSLSSLSLSLKFDKSRAGQALAGQQRRGSHQPDHDCRTTNEHREQQRQQHHQHQQPWRHHHALDSVFSALSLSVILTQKCTYPHNCLVVGGGGISHQKHTIRFIALSPLSYLRKIWWKCLAKEANSTDSAMTNPPTTAVRRVDFLLQRATRNGAKRWERATLVAPTQTGSKNWKTFSVYVNV